MGKQFNRGQSKEQEEEEQKKCRKKKWKEEDVAIPSRAGTRANGFSNDPINLKQKSWKRTEKKKKKNENANANEERFECEKMRCGNCFMATEWVTPQATKCRLQL